MYILIVHFWELFVNWFCQTSLNSWWRILLMHLCFIFSFILFASEKNLISFFLCEKWIKTFFSAKFLKKLHLKSNVKITEIAIRSVFFDQFNFLKAWAQCPNFVKVPNFVKLGSAQLREKLQKFEKFGQCPTSWRVLKMGVLRSSWRF